MVTTRVQLKFPLQLAQSINGLHHAEFVGSSVSELIESLDQRFGGVKERLLDHAGRVRPFLNIYVGRDNISTLDGMNTPLLEGQCVSILLSRAGG